MTDYPETASNSESKAIKKMYLFMKKLLGVLLLASLISCYKTKIEKNDLNISNAQTEDKLVTSFGKENSKRIERAKEIFLSPNSTATITEITVKSKSTGTKCLAYIISDDQYLQTDNSLVAPPDGCGSISGGWILHNDGCFYHGTLITACNGSTAFIEDPYPYTDGYIGNEPKCGYGGVAK